MTKPRLTIAVPTYNGAATLAQTLDSLVAQLETVPPGSLNILICNNASTDATADIAASYVAKHPEIRHHTHETTRCSDANYWYALEHADGEYVWLFADDDVLYPNAVAQVFSVLEADPIVAGVIVDCRMYNFATGTPLLAQLNTTPLKSPYRLHGAQAVLQDPICNVIGVVSTLILHRKALIDRDFSAIFSTSHTHIALVLHAAEQLPLLVLPTPLFDFRRDGEVRWNDKKTSLRFFLGFELAIAFIQSLHDLAIERVARKLWSLPQYALRVWGRGGEMSITELRTLQAEVPWLFRAMSARVATRISVCVIQLCRFYLPKCLQRRVRSWWELLS